MNRRDAHRAAYRLRHLDDPGLGSRLTGFLDGYDSAVADMADHDRQVAEKAWHEGWTRGFRDLQAGVFESDGYTVVTPTPNPYSLPNVVRPGGE